MSLKSRRDQLASIKSYTKGSTHTGLWFDKFLVQQVDTSDTSLAPYTQLIKEVSDLSGFSPAYLSFFTRWKQYLEKSGIQTRKATVNGRLAIGLGQDTVVETGVALHHTYGVPIIRGSSLKGLASSYAHQRLANAVWQKGGAAHTTLFGTSTKLESTAGLITFLDALPIPAEGKMLEPDVITVHHPSYYRGKEGDAAADWDNPIPISFLTVKGSFLVALYSPAEYKEWEEVAYNILKMALAEIGIGAKTSSGYGRITLSDPVLTPEQQLLKTFYDQLALLPTQRVATELHQFVQQWESDDIPQHHKKEMAIAILKKVESAKRIKQSKDKPWYKKLQAFVAGELPPAN